MATIIPLPTSRVSDLLVRQRLSQQIQTDQLDVLKLQTQLGTGRRVLLPSDDAPAALRAIGIQSLLERKGQVRVNLLTNQSFLAATDTALSSVANLIASARGEAVGNVGTTASDTQRAAAALIVQRATQQLLDIANQGFRGRFLFSGSKTTTRPFQQQGNFIKYVGDSQSVLSYSDIDVLFETNLTGDAALGAISKPVKGTSDFNPILTADTRLADLRGGLGISAGSVAVADGNTTSIVDISGAETVGDIVALLEANPPTGRTVRVDVTATGLNVSLDAAGLGNLTIREVGGGTTVMELGILEESGAGTGPVVGGDLNPRLKLTTPLANILGTRAFVEVSPAGVNNDLIFEAAQRGAAFNGVTVNFVDDSQLQAAPGLTAGNETVTYATTAVAARASLALPGASNDLILTAATAGTALNGVSVDIVDGGDIGDAATAVYNPGSKTLTLTVDDTDETSVDTLIAAIALDGTFTAARDASAEANVAGGVVPTAAAGVNVANTFNTGGDANTLFINIEAGVTTANQVIAAVTAEGTFTARLNTREIDNDGSGVIADSLTDPAAAGVTAGGSGIEFDQTSGLQIVNGAQTHVISLTTAETVEDLLNILNGSQASVLAEINATATGINLRSRLSGSDFTIGENGGTTATELGIRSFTTATRLEDLNFGVGVHTEEGADFAILRSDGTEFEIDLSAPGAVATTIADVLNLINNHPDNLAATVPVVARLATSGNGIEIVNDGPPGDGLLTIDKRNGSQAAQDLGFLGVNAVSATAQNVGAAATATVTMAGANNDLVFTAAGSGTQLEGVVVSFIDSGNGPGQESVSYNATNGTLIFDIDTATTTANNIVNVLSADPSVNTLFRASLDPADGSPGDGTGLIDLTATGTLAGGTAAVLSGADVNPLEVAGLFTALARLRDALAANDTRAIERAVDVLDAASLQLNFAHAELGARQQGLDVLQTRLDTEELELRSTLSVEIDVDLVDVISQLTSRQASFEASLQASALTQRVSLLDFL